MAKIQSMTGSGWSRGAVDGLGELLVDVRSVNGKSLSVKTRLPAAIQSLEREFDRRVRARIERGTVSLSVQVDRSVGAVGALLQSDQFAAVSRKLTALAAEQGLAEVSVRDVVVVLLALRGGSDGPSIEPGAGMSDGLAALLDEALDRLVAERETEGAATREAMREALRELAAGREAVAARAPQLIADYRQRLLDRVREFLDGRAVELEEAAVVREVALFADKSDIAEELQRLETHLQRLGALLDAGGAVGRQLEFLLQEALREVNTIGSKSPDVDTAHAVVAMKSWIDRLKEQAANLA